MKKVLFIFLLLNFCLAPAQDNKREFKLKPSFGLNGCQIHGDNFSGYDKLGFFAGIGINAKLNQRSSLELGFYFSQKGSRHNSNPEKGDYTFLRINLNYIDMPVSFRFMLTKQYFITLGASAAYLVSYAEENQYGDFSGVWPFEKFEVGVNGGLGRVISPAFSVELRSCNSIIPVRSFGVNTSNLYYPNIIAQQFTGGLYNNVLTLMLTYTIGEKTKNDPGP